MGYLAEIVFQALQKWGDIDIGSHRSSHDVDTSTIDISEASRSLQSRIWRLHYRG
ncbi:hypothetical protein [Haloarcula amylovorans]|uniref:hypothetical protein n=1 Tax=Haloarcula amylovorans TaxID=2562280 RepID=UPI00143142C2|nr:hypothetical protein [Halomicroarcula amylolytica]